MIGSYFVDARSAFAVTGDLVARSSYAQGYG
jgi:hypothetical protein